MIDHLIIRNDVRSAMINHLINQDHARSVMINHLIIHDHSGAPRSIIRSSVGLAMKERDQIGSDLIR